MGPGFRRDSEGEEGGCRAPNLVISRTWGHPREDGRVAVPQTRYPGESRGPSLNGSPPTGCGYAPHLSSSWPGLTRPSSRAFRGRRGVFWTPGSSPGVTRGGNGGLRSRPWGGGRAGWVPAFAGTARGEGGWATLSRISLAPRRLGPSERTVGTPCLESCCPGESRGPSLRGSSLTGCGCGADLSSSWPGLTRLSSRAFRGRGGSFWTPGSSPGVTRGGNGGLRSRPWGGRHSGWVPAFAGTARARGRLPCPKSRYLAHLGPSPRGR